MKTIVNSPSAMSNSKRTFTVDDFAGSGHYIVRNLKKDVKSDSYLSTIMYKVSYSHGANAMSKGEFNNYMLTAMSDGYIVDGYFNKNGSSDIDKWEFVPFTNKQSLIDFLNVNPHGESYRMATGDEVRRVVEYQHGRWAQPLTPVFTMPKTFWGKLKFLFSIK